LKWRTPIVRVVGTHTGQSQVLKKITARRRSNTLCFEVRQSRLDGWVALARTAISRACSAEHMTTVCLHKTKRNAAGRCHHAETVEMRQLVVSVGVAAFWPLFYRAADALSGNTRMALS
jgi:hypothetical protein